jgi:uncharacterized protein YlxW (UPF0749 family)
MDKQCQFCEDYQQRITELEAQVIDLENAVAAMRVTRDEMQKIIIQQDKGE